MRLGFALGLAKKILATALLLAALSVTARAATLSNVPNPAAWATDGPVYAFAHTSETLYLGGAFGYVGPFTGTGVPFDATTGKPAVNFPIVSGLVRACVADGAGGWFIGGDFLRVGGVTRYYLAHILACGAVDPVWNPNVNYHVYALAVSGSTVYVGGDFAMIGGQFRQYLAALDATTGKATPWDPKANGIVNTLAVSGLTVYAGGNFTSIGGQTRNRIAALDAATSAATAWAPNANASVYTLAVSGSTVYAGGNFSNIGGQTRNNIAALDAGTGGVTDWNPNANATIYALAISGSRVYAGGDFTSIGGQARNRLAALDAATGAATTWSPSVDNTVRALAIYDATVYAGGSFAHINRQDQRGIAALDTTNDTATPWSSIANNDVYALAVSGSTIFAGGYFTSLGGQGRSRLAALDAATGTLTPWNPSVGGSSDPYSVSALAVIGSTVYAGGNFSSIGGQPRNCIAALDAATGAATGWNPNANNTVKALVANSSTVYAGGDFTSIHGQTRNRLVALDTATDTPAAWDPNANATVNTIAVSGSTLYAGGSFTSVGGLARNHIAALDAVTGAATAWNPIIPNSDSWIAALAIYDRTIYIGGSFEHINGQSRNNIAALDAGTGNLTGWDPNANMSVYALASTSSTIYAGGNFTGMGGKSPCRLGALDAATGGATDFNGNANNTVKALVVNGATVYAGGNFSYIGGQDRYGFAQFDPLDLGPPRIKAQPASVVINSGQYASFLVLAVGSAPLSYQWRKGGTDLKDNGRIWGSQSNTLLINAAQASDAGLYDCVVTNSLGTTTSQVAKLTVNPSLTIISPQGNPTPAVGTRGYTAGTRITTQMAVTTTVDTAGTTRWLCTGWTAAGSAPASGSASSFTFTLDQPTTITWQWQATHYKLAAAASPGTGGRVMLADGVTAANGTWHEAATTVTLKAIANPGWSFKNWGGAAAGSATSASLAMNAPQNATATFIQKPVITGQPTPLTVDPEQTASFSVTATGAAPLSYQWKKNGSDLGGAKAATLKIGAAGYGDAGYYTCVVSNAAGSTASTSARLVVNPTLTVVSARGAPSPTVGTTVYTSGTQLTAKLAAATVTDSAGTTRWVCTGWTASGSAPASGSATSVSFKLTRPTTLTWLWKTQYKLVATASPASRGAVKLADSVTDANGSWSDTGTVLTLRAIPAAGSRFAFWWGSLIGRANPANLTMSQPQTLVACFDSQNNGVQDWLDYP